MSHFAGILSLHPGTDNSALEQAALKLLAREPSRAIQQLRHGRLWIVVQSLAVWQAPGAEQLPGGLCAVAGDPLLVDSQSDVADPVGSVRELGAALIEGRWQALQGCRGSFAAVGWNGERLLLATDKIGSRPLYWKAERERLVFATSLRLLRSLQAEPESVDEQGLAETLFFGQPLGQRTALAAIQVLCPGQFLRVEHAVKPQDQSYFNLADQTVSPLDYEQAVAELHRVFARAVKRRLQPGIQQAFLSGGLDSRAVVAALVDQGLQVQSFCAAYPGSLDDLVGRQIAARLGTQHLTWHRSPADRVRVALDPFAIYARDHFPSPDGRAQTARAIWSGDGGSVTLGHVYMDEARVELAGQALSADHVRKLFPQLAGRPTRQLSRQRLRQWADSATEGALKALQRTEDAPAERRLFLFYMQNDQARHLYHHFERINESCVELLTPFFDSDFVSLVQSLPIAWFLRHRLYNEWIQGFGCGAGEVYWQPYRSHIPGPHQAPSTTADQWDGSWYGGADVRRSYREIASELLRTREPLATPFMSRSILHLARLRQGLGLGGQEYEVAYARNLVHTLARD